MCNVDTYIGIRSHSLVDPDVLSCARAHMCACMPPCVRAYVRVCVCDPPLCHITCPEPAFDMAHMYICSPGGPTCTFTAPEGPHVHLQPLRSHMYICSSGGPTYTFIAPEGPHVQLQPLRAHMYICSPGGPTCTFAAPGGQILSRSRTLYHVTPFPPPTVSLQKGQKKKTQQGAGFSSLIPK